MTQTKEVRPKNSESWKRWFRDNGNRLFLFARQQTRNDVDAEDVLQDAMVRLWRTTRGGDNGVPDLPLAFTAIRHAAIDAARKSSRRMKREFESELVVDATRDRFEWWGSDSMEEQERAHALKRALREIPQKFAEVLTLKIWGDQTFAEIAETLAISPNTAASRYRYGLEALKTQLSKNPEFAQSA